MRESSEFMMPVRRSNASFLRLTPGAEGPAGAFVMVFKTGFLHRAVCVLRRLHFLQMSRGQFPTGRHPGHLLVDGGLRVRLDTAACFALTATETGGKQISEGNKQS